jgi:hypothetical protein
MEVPVTYGNLGDNRIKSSRQSLSGKMRIPFQ